MLPIVLSFGKYSWLTAAKSSSLYWNWLKLKVLDPPGVQYHAMMAEIVENMKSLQTTVQNLTDQFDEMVLIRSRNKPSFGSEERS